MGILSTGITCTVSSRFQGLDFYQPVSTIQLIHENRVHPQLVGHRFIFIIVGWHEKMIGCLTMSAINP